MKRILCISLLLLAMIFTLAACGGKDNPPSNDGGGETQEHTHNFGDWEITKNPTCTEDGAKVRYCSCGEKQSEVIAKLGHTPGEAAVEDKVDPTYEANGSYNEVVRCTTCNEKLSETSHVIPMLKHTPADAVEENRVEATCYREGSYDIVVYCSDCRAELERAKHTIGKIEHTPATALEENFIDSTCYSVGSKDIVVYCSVAECHAELERNTETISKKAHTPANAVEENRVEPTFEKDGSYQTVIYCSVAECHEELERTTHTLDMLVHHPGSVVIENEVAATCTKTGSYDEVVYCLDDNCGHKELSRKTITVPMIPHTNGATVEENRANATCYAEGGYDNVVYCSVCGTELSRATVTLQKIAHSPANAVIENKVEATCTADGSYDEVVYCSVEECNAQISRATKIIDALGHTEVIDAAVEATCFTLGHTEGKHCSVCGTITVSPIYYTSSHIYENHICTVCGSGIEFRSNGDGTCSMNLGNCTETDIVIPAVSPNGDIVTSFNGFVYSEVRSVVIPDTVLSIPGSAFYRCSDLTKVVIGNSVTRIEAFAFSETSIHSIVIPDSVENIGTGAFRYCYNLTSVTFGDGLTQMECDVFDSCYDLVYNEYEGCKYLGSKDNPYFVLIKKASYLYNFTTHTDTKVIAGCAFEKSSITSIIIYDNLTSISDYAFSECDDLNDIYYTGSKEDWNKLTIGSNSELNSATIHYNYIPEE